MHTARWWGCLLGGVLVLAVCGMVAQLLYLPSRGLQQPSPEAHRCDSDSSNTSTQAQLEQGRSAIVALEARLARLEANASSSDVLLLRQQQQLARLVQQQQERSERIPPSPVSPDADRGPRSLPPFVVAGPFRGQSTRVADYISSAERLLGNDSTAATTLADTRLVQGRRTCDEMFGSGLIRRWRALESERCSPVAGLRENTSWTTTARHANGATVGSPVPGSEMPRTRIRCRVLRDGLVENGCDGDNVAIDVNRLALHLSLDPKPRVGEDRPQTKLLLARCHSILQPDDVANGMDMWLHGAMEEVRDNETRSCDVVVNHPVFFILRWNINNPFHIHEDLLHTFIAYAVNNVPVDEVQVIIADRRGIGNLYDFWQHVYSPTQRVVTLQQFLDTVQLQLEQRDAVRRRQGVFLSGASRFSSDAWQRFFTRQVSSPGEVLYTDEGETSGHHPWTNDPDPGPGRDLGRGFGADANANANANTDADAGAGADADAGADANTATRGPIVCFKKSIFNVHGGVSLMSRVKDWPTNCGMSAILRGMSDFHLDRFGLLPRKLSDDHDPLDEAARVRSQSASKEWFGRALRHARGDGEADFAVPRFLINVTVAIRGEGLSRQLPDQAHLVQLLRGIPFVHLRTVDFSQLGSTRAQLAVARQTEVLVGAHGASLIWSLYMPPHGAVLEIRHGERRDSHHYASLARLCGLLYEVRHVYEYLLDDGFASDIRDKVVDFTERVTERLLRAGSGS